MSSGLTQVEYELLALAQKVYVCLNFTGFYISPLYVAPALTRAQDRCCANTDQRAQLMSNELLIFPNE